MVRPKRALVVAFLVTAAVLLACAGGSGEGDPPPGSDSEPTPEVDPSPAEEDEAEPGGAPHAAGEEASISPSSGDPGTEVTVRAGGFAPGDTLVIGIGPPESEYVAVDTVVAGASGDVSATVRVSDEAERGRPLVFVVATPDASRKAISPPFHVLTLDGTVRIEGDVTDEGVECTALRTRGGVLYTLTGGGADRLEPGSRVTVEGTIAEVSFCQQGTTIAVTAIEER